MSMCWYLHSYPIESFDQVFGSATSAQERKLIKLISDPDEGFEDDDERDAAVELAKNMMHHGIDMSDMTEDEKDMIDNILALAMHDIGLGKELKVRPRSPEPVTLKVAGAILSNAPKIDAKLLPLFNNGRRFGLSEGRRLDCYFFLTPDEVSHLKDEADRLLTESSVQWPHLDFPKFVRANLAEPLAKIAQSPGEGLYARLG